MRKPLVSLLSLVVAAAISAPLSAQSCSKLAVTGSGKSGTDLKISLTGAAKRSFAFLFLSQKTGKTVIKVGPLGTLTLGLAMPVIPLPFGRTDASGAATATIKVPKIPQTTLNAQGSTVQLKIGRGRPSLEFCTSNVVTFKIGG